jgi:hypothetical protein
VIDIHTGLDEVGQLEIFTEENGTKFERLAISVDNVSAVGCPSRTAHSAGIASVQDWVEI